MALTVSGSTSLTAGTQSGNAADKLDEDLNQFMNLLVTQLQNQDPLDPMDATEFTNQLVQFASVEQQIYQNSNLEQLLALQSTSQVADMVNYIGNVVEISGGNMVNFDGAEAATYSYSLSENSATTTINIRDQDGISVFTTDGQTTTGRHDATWDGRNQNGNIVPPGIYTIQISALDGKGNLLDVFQTSELTVTGAAVDNGEISLIMGDTFANFNDVLAVKAPKSANAPVN